MRFHSALISSFLLVSAAVAHYQIDGGALLTGSDDQTFHTVSTAVNVPQLSGEPSDSITVMATLGSESCPSSASIGFTCAIQVSLQTMCVAWFHVNPDKIEYFNLAIDPDDTVIFGVTSPYHQHHPVDEYVTYAFIENSNTSLSSTLNSMHTACGRKAGWGVSNTPDDGTFNGIARFGRLEFTTTVAYTPGGEMHGPADQMGPAWNMTDHDGHLIAIVEPSGNSMVITDVRG